VSGNGVEEITISGDSGIFSVFNPTSGIALDAKNKGLVTVGTQRLRNLTSTGALTWSGEVMIFGYNTSNPNVCTRIYYEACTVTLSANGQTMTINNGAATYTRQ